MGITTEAQYKSVNVLSLGVLPQTGISSAQRQANSQKLNDYAALGWSLYFPPGDYEIEGELTWSSAENICVHGDDAKIYQITRGQKVLRFTNVDGLVVRGLHLYSSYFGPRTVTPDVTGSSAESCIYAQQCANVIIESNTCEGYNCWAMAIMAGDNISIVNNHFKDGNWTAGNATTENTADIRLEPISGEQPRNVLIRGNHCNTNSLVGIMALRPSQRVICTDNFCITTDNTGTELTGYSAGQRKAGIELQYYLDAADGNDNADSSQYELTINNNQIQGCRYSGISCQSNAYFTNNSGGIRGTISNNLIRYAATEQAAQLSSYITNGITVNNCRELIISGNVIKDVELPSSTGTAAGIFVRYGSDETIVPTGSGGTLKSCIISDNIITDCRCRGIYLHDVGDITISGNTIRDVQQAAIFQFETGASNRLRAGKTRIIGNTIASTLTWNASAVVLQGNDPDYLISNNVVEMTGTAPGTPYAFDLRCNGRLVFVGNSMIGSGGGGTTPDTRAVKLELGQLGDPNIRFDKLLIANNRIDSFAYGFFATDNTNTIGPIIHHNTLFSNVNRDVWSNQQYQIYSGQWQTFGDDNVNCTVYADQAPSAALAGNWLAGDICYNSSPTSGNPMGWVCTTGGQGAASVWAPMVNIP